MSHKNQQNFVQKVKNFFPEYFKNVSVVEIGSLNINGSIRDFFDTSKYAGYDLIEGKGVDIVCPGYEIALPDNSIDTVISTECFEHDKFWKKTFENMYRMTKKGGAVIFTCASTGRPEHGTTASAPADSPATNDYYGNLTQEDFDNAFDLSAMFLKYSFEYNSETFDLYFWGIKK